jgi:hypothetical protein
MIEKFITQRCYKQKYILLHWMQVPQRDTKIMGEDKDGAKVMKRNNKSAKSGTKKLEKILV